MDVGIKNLLDMWGAAYYVDGLSIAVSAGLLFRLLKSNNKSQIKSLAILYFISIFILFTISAIVVLSLNNRPKSVKIIESLNMGFNCVEVYVLFKLLNHAHQTTNSNRIQKVIFYILILTFLYLIILFLRTDISTPNANYECDLMTKTSEIIEVIKRCIICTPCIFYFAKVFKSNSPFQLNEALMVFAIFSYCIFGILAYSIAENISTYKQAKSVILILPTATLWFVCGSILNYIKSETVKFI